MTDPLVITLCGVWSVEPDGSPVQLTAVTVCTAQSAGPLHHGHTKALTHCES